MIKRMIMLMMLSILFTVLMFGGCDKNGSERLSAQELALLSELESTTTPQSTPEESTPPSSTQESTTADQPAAKKKTAAAGGAVVEIREKMFIAQTNDVYINKNDYLGKTIKYEGIFDRSTWRGNGKTYNYVIRFGPGCCPGDAAAAGFEVVWDKEYPKKNDWVEAVGVLNEYDDDGIPTLRLSLTSLTVLAKRGKERVTQ